MNIQVNGANRKKNQELALKLFYHHFNHDYLTLMNENGKAAMKVQRLRNLALEVID